ncbi:DEAD/DEAH box helicase [Priestia filamentosa]|uniref:DEAD/DEAH box helicase n=1 Tax=Priestia filamentosa TaxID=1402861 RepID=UPI001FB49999|nr:DEAD/DEAH box helicase [Priestia filamentosa]UOE58280.1 DEAD/DEAH box helicase [Priestia filamentosa]
MLDYKKEINDLLRYDLEQFAKKLGISNKESLDISNSQAAKLLNIAENLSRNLISNEDKEMCLLICSLLWEYRKENWKALSRMLVIIFSRLGLNPTTKMVDESYDEENDTFSSLGSIIDELNITASHSKYEVEVGNRSILFSSFQKNIWDLIDKNNRIGISAPTSAGKSFVLVNKIVDMILKGKKKFLYVVPTISLINQVSLDLRKEVRKQNLDNVHIYQSITKDYDEDNGAYIYVLTQERVLSSLSLEPNFFRGITLVVIDEIQNIERVTNEGDERAHTMYDVIQEIDSTYSPQKIIISGPRLKNIGSLVKKLFGVKGGSLSDDLPPVINLTYSFSKVGKNVYLNQYSTINTYPISILVNIDNNLVKSLFNKKLYDNGIHSFIKLILDKTKINNSGSIVFSPTSRQSVATANELAGSSSTSEISNLLSDLISYLENTVHPNYSLINPLRYGIAYHNGKMPLHVRMVIEKAFSELVIDTIVCTTTLMQGINLPAKNIIARNPNLFTRENRNHDNARLTGYEFANLRGRSGRLMKDIVGRTIVLDESTFTDAQINLFEHEEKEINTGYGDRFEENREDILENVTTIEEASLNEENIDLKIYIRQMVLKYQYDSIKRFKRVGINISENKVNEIIQTLNKLSVSNQICKSNQYWDPIELNKLYLAYRSNKITRLPDNIYDDKYVKKICTIINEIKLITPYFYKKYFGIDGNGAEKRIFSIVKFAQQWSKEEPLVNIINWDNTVDLEAIDKRIETINTDVMYSIPKLLKPIAQIQNENNAILTFMELGAYQPLTIRMIEYGLPRETAIKVTSILKRHYAEQFNQNMSKDDCDQIINTYVDEIIHELNYWEIKQLKNIFYL